MTSMLSCIDRLSFLTTMRRNCARRKHLLGFTLLDLCYFLTLDLCPFSGALSLPGVIEIPCRGVEIELSARGEGKTWVNPYLLLKPSLSLKHGL